MATFFQAGIDLRNHASHYPSVGRSEQHKGFLWEMLASGAIVCARDPNRALSAHCNEGRDKITENITALETHTDSSNRTYWSYFELVRPRNSGDRHEFHILLDEKLGGVKFN